MWGCINFFKKQGFCLQLIIISGTSEKKKTEGYITVFIIFHISADDI